MQGRGIFFCLNFKAIDQEAADCNKSRCQKVTCKSANLDAKRDPFEKAIGKKIEAETGAKESVKGTQSHGVQKGADNRVGNAQKKCKKKVPPYMGQFGLINHIDPRKHVIGEKYNKELKKNH